jgi:hypothetical protein
MLCLKPAVFINKVVLHAKSTTMVLVTLHKTSHAPVIMPSKLLVMRLDISSWNVILRSEASPMPAAVLARTLDQYQHRSHPWIELVEQMLPDIQLVVPDTWWSLKSRKEFISIYCMRSKFSPSSGGLAQW